MGKGLIIGVVVVLVLAASIFYGISSGGDDEVPSSEDKEIPSLCSEFKEDVCGLFDCMVNSCWCDEGGPEAAILYEQSGVSLSTAGEAVDYIKRYVSTNGLGYNVKNAVKLNNIFYNVFSEDSNGDEIVYTLSVDGTIIKTICGV
ncbi:MAG: hypothetical protein NUV37_01230 [Nanoarchaeota archaeon]|nr:hypothetical protein [Nanoarchaeota archaeon]